jgi:hypothetical protein
MGSKGTFLASALDGYGQSASYFSHFTCREKTLVPTIGDWMGLRADLDIKKKEKSLPLAWNQTSTTIYIHPNHIKCELTKHGDTVCQLKPLCVG